MIRIKRILVPVDFSEPSKTAVKSGLSLAAAFDAELILANIAPFDRDLYEKAKTQLMELIPADVRESLHFDTIVKSGDIRDEILGIVADRQADLIVMGSHGRGALGRMMLGSVTEQVLRRLPVPVLAVRNTPIVSLKRFLYACDLGGDADAGLQFSIRLARGLDASLTVAHVIDPLGTGFLNEQTVGYMPEFADNIRAQAEYYLDRLVALQSDGSVPISTVLQEGIPAAAINETATECKADLIIINLHSKGALERALLGATAERVIRTAPVPVLGLPLPAAYASRWQAA